MSLHPALEHARDGLLARRGLREKFGHHVTARAQHEPLQAAYQYVGESFWFRILYCRGCLRGHVVDLVREVPANARTARELGLRQMRPWRLECTETQQP
jgi:hypothetical protein